MSERKIDYWGKNSEEAFGEAGAKGDRGEDAAIILLTPYVYDIKHCQDQLTQCGGTDIIIKHYKGSKWEKVQVKNNLRCDHDRICVEWEAIKKSDAIFWLHMNDTNSNNFAMYRRKIMISHINKSNYTKTYYKGDLLYWVPAKDLSDDKLLHIE